MVIRAGSSNISRIRTISYHFYRISILVVGIGHSTGGNYIEKKGVQLDMFEYARLHATALTECLFFCDMMQAHCVSVSYGNTDSDVNCVINSAGIFPITDSIAQMAGWTMFMKA